jgi:hypothetical protein
MKKDQKSGTFEEFRSDWLLQVAADRAAKSAAPVAIALAFGHLNRGNGSCWPSIETLMKRTGAEAKNTVRSALKVLEGRGHAHINWTKGGQKNTNVIVPLVAGKPFKKLKGSQGEAEGSNPSTFRGGTLQVSDHEPFKRLKGNHLIEPTEKPSDSGGAPQAPAAYSIGHQSQEDAPSTAPEGAEGEKCASIASPDLDDFDDFFKERDFEEFIEEESPVEFIENGNPHLPIRSTPKGWRNLLAWIGEAYGPFALRRAAAEKRTGTLTIETILNFQGGAADVA